MFVARWQCYLILALTASGSNLAAQSIVTVVGGGSDDARVATQAAVVPIAVAVDGSGNLYIADHQNHRVRKVAAGSGIISTVAGSGGGGYFGDNGLATAAALFRPSDVLLDGAGNLLIADYFNYRVRRVNLATGIITTIAGNGQSTPTTDNIPATAAALNGAGGIALDSSGNLYIAETFGNRIRKVSTTGIVSTFVGNGISGFSGDNGPAALASIRLDIFSYHSGLVADRNGNLYLADSGNHRIRKVAPNGTITTVAGNGTAGSSGDGGAATAAMLLSPRGLDVDASGNLYIADSGPGIRKVTIATGIISTVASVPGSDMAFDSAGNMYVADPGANVLRRVAPNGSVTTVAGNGARSFLGNGGPATAGGLLEPAAVDVDVAGNLYIADEGNHQIRKVDKATGLISTVAGTGVAGFSGDNGPATAARLAGPTGVAVDAAGNIYIADTLTNRIRRVAAATQVITTIAGTGTRGFGGDNGPATSASLALADFIVLFPFEPVGIDVDNAGNVYIGDIGNNRIRRITAAGVITTIAGTGARASSGDNGPATSAALSPRGLALDSVGNLFVADPFANRIRRIAPNGIITTVAGTGQNGSSGDGGQATAARISYPEDVDLDAAGNLYIADAGNSQVRKVTALTGVITRVAGTGTTEYSGDGGPATSASIGFDPGIAVDRSGNLFIADTYSNRIRAVSACNAVASPTLLAPINRAADVSTQPQISWSAVTGAFRYDVYLSRANQPALIASDVAATTHTPSNLIPGATYFWRIVAKGDRFCPAQSTAGTEIRSFTTATACGAPAAFEPLQPSDGMAGIGAPAQLTWQPAAGAGTYDLYFGPSNPPPLLAAGLTTAGHTVASLTAGAVYYWYVVAHASCDATKTTATRIRSFRTAGGCSGAQPFALTTPFNGATGVGTTTTLDWAPSQNASSYDLYLGTRTPPPLYLADIEKPRTGVSGLEPQKSYYWRVVAKAACDPTRNVTSDTQTFATGSSCALPPATSITFVPPGNVGVGQTYAVTWRELPALGAEGFYIIDRSTSSSFATTLDSQQVYSNSASFTSSAAGTYHHRVRAVSGCAPTQPGSPSPVRSVTVVAGAANVIFTVQPQAVITGTGEKLEGKKTRFTIENIGPSRLQVSLSRAEIEPSVPFFTLRDPEGGDTLFLTLEPGRPKSFDIEFSGPRVDASGNYQGVIFINAAGQSVVPYAFVNLKVGGGATSAPVFVVKGATSEYAFFPGFAGEEDANRPPITVSIRNTGSAAMELGAEIGPDVWLAPDPRWNESAIPAGALREITLKTNRSRALNGSALPRYTYFTVRSRNGETARLLVQDNDAPPTAFGRSSLLAPGSRSFVIPGVVSATSSFTRLRMTNVGSDAVQTELYFTPSGSDGFNGAVVKRATVVVPPNDVVTLTDPLAQVFGLPTPSEGQIEIRAAPENVGFLVVTSSTVTPATTGGTYRVEMPTLLLGEGAASGSPHVVFGVAANTTMRTALTLVETSGTEATRIRAVLFDAQGIRKGDRVIDLLRYGQTRIENVVTSLGGSEPLEAGRIEINVESGGGTVTGVVTMVDATRNNGASLVSQRSAGLVLGTSSGQLQRMRIAAVSADAVAPMVVNGLSSRGAQERTTMGFTSTSGSAITAVLTFRPRDGAPAITKSIPIPTAVALRFENVLEELFGIGAGQNAIGSIFVEAAAGGVHMYSRLSRLVGSSWTIGSGLPIVATLSDAISSISSKRPLYLDGMEQSIDPTRGSRWSVSVHEIGGNSGSVRVRLYEAGNRSVPIAERQFPLNPYQHLALETVFSSLGLDTDERRKDRTDVLCVVSADGGSVVLSAVATVVDSRTGDTHRLVFTPNGGIPTTGELRISKTTEVPPEPPVSRRRVVRR